MTHFTYHVDPGETMRDWGDVFPVYPQTNIGRVRGERVAFELVAPLTPNAVLPVEALYNALVDERLGDYPPGTFEHGLRQFEPYLKLYWGRRYETRLVLQFDLHVATGDVAMIQAFADWFHDFASSLNEPGAVIVGLYKWT